VNKKHRGGGGGGGMPDMGGLMGMLQKAQEQSEQMKVRLEAQLKEKIVEGSTGGGVVKVTATGTGDIRTIKIDASLLKESEKDMVEDLVVAAVNVAIKKARALQEDAQQGELGSMMQGMGLGGAGGGGGMPDLSKLLGGK
jgi:DNA-binding YbaB/EbfC family protein